MELLLPEASILIHELNIWAATIKLVSKKVANRVLQNVIRNSGIPFSVIWQYQYH
jgi:hypothetical protein